MAFHHDIEGRSQNHLRSPTPHIIQKKDGVISKEDYQHLLLLLQQSKKAHICKILLHTEDLLDNSYICWTQDLIFHILSNNSANVWVILPRFTTMHPLGCYVISSLLQVNDYFFQATHLRNSKLSQIQTGLHVKTFVN